MMVPRTTLSSWVLYRSAAYIINQAAEILHTQEAELQASRE
jgi:hypothetical protein